jgi:hypothetical protein
MFCTLLLQMEHDPALHLSFTSAPRHWADPALTAVDEPGFLQQMRPLLNRYDLSVTLLQLIMDRRV